MDDHSMMEDVASNYPEEMLTESIASDLTNPQLPPLHSMGMTDVRANTFNNAQANVSAFISSEESDMVDFTLDDQSIASSQWEVMLPYNANHQSSVLAAVDPSTATSLLQGIEYPAKLDDADFDSDDDMDYEDIDDLLEPEDSSKQAGTSKPLCASATEVLDAETMQSMIRQGLVPKMKPNKVCSRPVECRQELMRLLRDDCQGSSTRFTKSDCTMQFRGKIHVTVPVNENTPNHLVSLTALVPLHATRGVLRNTKYLSAIRDSVNGKILTEEEEEDAAVLSLLGE